MATSSSSLESCNGGLHDLKSFISSEQYKRLKNALTGDSLHEIQKDIEDSCDVGQLFDITKNNFVSQKLKLNAEDVCKTESIQKLNIKTINKGQPSIHFIYQTKKESLPDKDYGNQKTILNTLYAHFIHSQVKGYRAEINLLSDLSVEDLFPLIKFIEDPEVPGEIEIPENVTYTVTGKLPELYLDSDAQTLSDDDIDSLREFHQENYFQSFDEIFTLSATIRQFSLESFYSPIFGKLILLNTNFAESTFKCIVNCIIVEIIDNIIMTAILIKSGQNYLERNKFLLRIYKSFLLKPITLKNLFAGFQNKIDSKTIPLKSSSTSYKRSPSENQCSIPESKAIAEVENLIRSSLKEQNFKLTSDELLNTFETNLENYFKTNTISADEISTNRSVDDKRSSISDSNLSESDSDADGETTNFEAPANLIAQQVSADAIQLFWTLPLKSRNLNRQYRVEYKKDNCEDLKANEIQKVPSDREKISTLIKNLEPGHYKFRIKIIFGGQHTSLSDWSQANITKESGLNALQTMIEEKLFKNLQMNLNSPVVTLPYEPMGDCETGWLFDVENKKQTDQKLQFDNQDRSTEPSAEKITVTKKQKEIIFFYNHSKETISKSVCLKQKTILDTPYTHYIDSIERGFIVKVSLRLVEENQQEKLENIIDIIVDEKKKNPRKVPKIYFTVSGKIPSSEKVEERLLKKEDFSIFKKFHDETFYRNLGNICTSRVYLAPFHLEHYYSPIFEKLALMKANLPSLNDGRYVSNFVDIIVHQFLEKVSETTRSIASGSDYIQANQFLYNTGKDLLWDANFIQSFFQDLQGVIDKIIQQFKSQANADFITKSKITVKFCIKFSLKKAKEEMENLISAIFQENKHENFNKKNLLDNFEADLNNQRDQVLLKLNEIKENCGNSKGKSKGGSIPECQIIFAEEDEYSSVNLKFFKNNHELDPQPSILMSPYGLIVKEVSNDSISVSWSVSNDIKAMATSYQIEFVNISKEGSPGQQSNTKDAKCSDIIKNLKSGLYTIRVKAIYDGIQGAFSEWSESIPMKEFKKSMEKDQSMLLEIIGPDEFESIKETMDLSQLPEFQVEENLIHDYEIGWAYDMNSNKPSFKTKVLPNFLSANEPDIKLQKPENELVSDRHGKMVLVYHKYIESLTNTNFALKTTINDTIHVHYISSLIKGFRAEIDVHFSKGETKEISNLMKTLLETKNSKPDLIKSGTNFSIAGKLPDKLRTENQKLTPNEMKKIRLFLDEKHYETFGESFTLRITVSPMNLDTFYSPIIEELVKLKQKFSTTNDPPFNSIIEVIVKNVIQKIKEVINLIKNGGFYHTCNEFLVKLRKSIILNAICFEDFYKLMRNVVQEEKQRLLGSFPDCSNTNYRGLSVNCNVALSIKKPLQKIERRIENCFTRNDFKINPDEFVDLFKNHFDNERNGIQLKVNSITAQIARLKEIDSKSELKLSIMVTSAVNIGQSDVQTKLSRNGALLPLQPPIFSVPEDIVVEKTTKDSVTLCWKLSEDAQVLASSFKAYYRQTKDDGKAWKCVSVMEKTNRHTTHNLSPGAYVFSIQVIYGDIAGMCSDISAPISPVDPNLRNARQKNQINPQDYVEDFYAYNLQDDAPDFLCELFKSTVTFLRDSQGMPHTLRFPRNQNISLGDVYYSHDSKFQSNINGSMSRDAYSVSRDESDPQKNVIDDESASTFYKEILCVQYTEVKELKSDRLQNIRISDTTATHIVTCIHHGNWISIKLSTEKSNKRCLDQVCNKIDNELNEKNRNQERRSSWLKTITKRSNISFSDSDFTTPIQYCITGSCSSVKNCENKSLKKKNIESVTKIDYINSLKDEKRQAIVNLQVSPVEMETYFKPLLLKLKDLINSLNTIKQNDLTEIVSSFTRQILVKVKETSSLIRDNENSQSSVLFLQDIYKSNALNIKYIEKLLQNVNQLNTSVEENCNQRLQSLSGSKKQFVVRINIGFEEISLQEIHSELETEIRENQDMKNFETAHERFKAHANRVQQLISKEMDKVIYLQKCSLEKNKEIYFEVELTKNANVGIEINLFKNGVPVASKMPLLEGPQNVRESQTGKDSITVKWKPAPNSENFVRSYRINYRKVDECGKPQSEWQSVYADNTEQFKTVEGLTKGDYVFRVQAIYDDIASVYSEESDPISTRFGLTESIIEHLSPIKNKDGSESNPVVYELPVKEMITDQDQKRRICYYEKYEKCPPVEKTIMLLGATGSGKSTFINGLINNVFNVDYTDDFRLKLINVKEGESNKSQSNSQTEWITNYQIPPLTGSRIDYTINIIDTPGFGDTSGIKRDEEIFDQIKQFFEKDVPLLHAVCIVIPSSQMRLTPTQIYIFNRILAIFGKDVENHIYILATFADSPEPPVIASLKEAGVPCYKFFVFNNSALYAKKGQNFGFTRMFWNMGTDSFKIFLESLKDTVAVSLQLTKEVLTYREHIEVSISNMQNQMGEGLCQLENIKQHQTQLETYMTKAKDTENIQYTTKETHQEKIDLEPGKYVTNCLVCNYTCHYPCKIPRDEDKKRCAAMNQDGFCETCCKNCIWSEHVNNPYRFELKSVEVKREYAETKKEYGIAKNGIDGMHQLIDKLQAKYKETQQGVEKLIVRIRDYVNKLREIALLPKPLDLEDYIDVLIESEKQKKSEGFLARIAELERIKQKSNMLKEIVEKPEVVNPILQTDS